MAYGAVPNTTATSSRRPQVAATVLLLAAGLCATALVAFKAPLPTSGKVSDADLNARAAAALAQYADTISDMSAWTEKRDASKKGAIALPETEKTDQNTWCVRIRTPAEEGIRQIGMHAESPGCSLQPQQGAGKPYGKARDQVVQNEESHRRCLHRGGH